MFTEIQYIILATLDANEVTTPLSGMTVNEIFAKVYETSPCSESAVYNAVTTLYSVGYILKGIKCGRANTYYLSRTGYKILQSIT